MKTTKRRRRAGRSRFPGILMIGGAALLSALVTGMRRRSRKTRPTQRLLLSGMEVRERLLKDLPLTEHRLDLAGVSTSLLEGAEGSPIVLLHGQGNFAAAWMPVITGLVNTHHVIAPDMPGLGASEVRDGLPTGDTVLAWLGELIEQVCSMSSSASGDLAG